MFFYVYKDSRDRKVRGEPRTICDVDENGKITFPLYVLI